eukprot:IDg11683t1
MVTPARCAYGTRGRMRAQLAPLGGAALARGAARGASRGRAVQGNAAEQHMRRTVQRHAERVGKNDARAERDVALRVRRSALSRIVDKRAAAHAISSVSPALSSAPVGKRRQIAITRPPRRTAHACCSAGSDKRPV